MKDIKSSIGVVKRATAIGVILSLIALFLLFKILLLQTVDYEKYEEIVISQMTTESVVKADRGKIYDVNGTVLATNITTYRIFISPSAIKSAMKDSTVKLDEIISAGLAEILGLDYENVLKQTTYTDKLDRTIAREVKEETAELVWKYINDNKYNNMIFTEATSTRYYPYSTLAANIIGAAGTGYGLEAQYNSYLTGTDGKYITARDSHGREMPYEYDSYIDAVDGCNITTTIDVYVQAALEEQLKTTYTESGGKNRACGIVMDVNTGAIKAMAVYPAFDLNNPRELGDQFKEKLTEAVAAEEKKLSEERGEAVTIKEGSAEYTAIQTNEIMSMWSNKAITEPYMPGSTFKVVTASMAYEENLVKETETFSCPGYYIVNGRKIRCHKTTGHGALTFEQGIQQSCNPVLMQMGLRIGAEKFYDYFKTFGYRAKSGIDLPGEVDAKSLFWDRETFTRTDINLAVASFGQNFKVTAIQQITAISAVANGGYLVTPHLLEEVTDRNGNVIYSYDAQNKRQIVSKETCEKVSAILEAGVSGNGGAKNAYVAGYRIAAKTGTSEKKDEGDGKYVCSCIGFAPADDPQYAAIILVDEPTKGVIYGSVIAAPYISNLMGTILPYLDVEAVYSDEELKKKAVEVPGLTYWTKEAAKSYAETLGFEVEFKGNGNTVRSQSPAAGVYVESGSAKIILYMDKNVEKTSTTVPDLIGKTAVAADQMLATRNLNIKISGTKNYLSGTGIKAITQSPAAATVVEEGTVVTVTFGSLTDDDRAWMDDWD